MTKQLHWFSKKIAVIVLLVWAAANGGGVASAGTTSLASGEGRNDSPSALWEQVKARLCGESFPALEATFDHEVLNSPFGISTHRKLNVRRGAHGVFRYASENISGHSRLCTRLSWNGTDSVSYVGTSSALPVVDGIFRVGDRRIDGPADLLDTLLFPLTAVDDVNEYEVISFVDGTLLLGVGETPRLAIHFVSQEVLAYDEVQYFNVQGTLQRTRSITGWFKLGEVLVPNGGEVRDKEGELLERFAFASISRPDLRYEDFTLEIPHLAGVLVQYDLRKAPVSAAKLDATRLAAKDYRAAFGADVLARAKP